VLLLMLCTLCCCLRLLLHPSTCPLQLCDLEEQSSANLGLQAKMQQIQYHMSGSIS